MNKYIIFAFALIASGNLHAEGKSHWGYSGHQGPENWAALSSDNFACSGRNQSPVNLTGFIEAELPAIQFDYKAGGTEILNNGHTVQINYAKGSSISIDGKTFQLLQFHFHAPSENHINGKSYPMEAHLVHADSKGNLAVVAVMFEQGAANEGLSKPWMKMPGHTDDKNSLSAMADVNDVLPQNRDYYRFNGSLTTPPCSEGVRWFVLKDTATASKAQISAFAGALHEANNRPIQPLNARPVLN